jgi:hypothetical protein
VADLKRSDGLLDMFKRQPTPFAICGLGTGRLRQEHWTPESNEVRVGHFRANCHGISGAVILPFALLTQDNCRYLRRPDRTTATQVFQSSKCDSGAGLFGD